MPCPKFIDFTRECLKEVEILPNNTFKYCTTEKHKDCPFFRIINKEKNVCENIKSCYFFHNFQLHDFEEFVEVSDKYCTGVEHKKCKRYVLKKEGKKVPKNLSPEGRIIEKYN